MTDDVPEPMLQCAECGAKFDYANGTCPGCGISFHCGISFGLSAPRDDADISKDTDEEYEHDYFRG